MIYAISFFVMIWKSLILFTGCESPIVAILSGGLDSFYSRGDLMFLSCWNDKNFKVGDLVAFTLPEVTVPIVHRVIHMQPK